MNERVAVDDPVVDEAVAWMSLFRTDRPREASAGLLRWPMPIFATARLGTASRVAYAFQGRRPRVPGLGGSLVEVIDRKRSRRELCYSAAAVDRQFGDGGWQSPNVSIPWTV